MSRKEPEEFRKRGKNIVKKITKIDKILGAKYVKPINGIWAILTVILWAMFIKIGYAALGSLIPEDLPIVAMLPTPEINGTFYFRCDLPQELQPMRRYLRSLHHIEKLFKYQNIILITM